MILSSGIFFFPSRSKDKCVLFRPLDLLKSIVQIISTELFTCLATRCGEMTGIE